jgi:hypothetical protein
MWRLFLSLRGRIVGDLAEHLILRQVAQQYHRHATRYA